MFSFYTFTIDIIAPDSAMSQSEFYELVNPCISCLQNLQGSFGHNERIETYFPPFSECTPELESWSVRAVVMIRLEPKLGEHLENLYHSLYDLISFRLDQASLKADISVFRENS